MTAFLLYSQGTGETGRLLGEALDIPYGTTPPNERVGLLIRWGSTERVEQRPHRVLNSSRAIAAASDKMGSLIHLSQRGVPVPRCESLAGFDVKHLTLQHFVDLGWNVPVLARERHHTRGEDIVLCLQTVDFVRAHRWGRDYVVEYIPTKYEYRVHVFKGEIIRISEKVLKSRDKYVSYLRNFDNNFTFKNERHPLTDEGRTQAINAVRELGLDFGAVDIVITDTGNPVVLEVNTGPSLIDTGLGIYCRYFRQEITNATL